MKIWQEISLKDFQFWGGAKHTASWLSEQDFEELEALLIDGLSDEPINNTSLNDLFWFEEDEVVRMLGYDDFEDLMKGGTRK